MDAPNKKAQYIYVLGQLKNLMYVLSPMQFLTVINLLMDNFQNTVIGPKIQILQFKCAHSITIQRLH